MWYIVSTGIGISLLTSKLFSKTIDMSLDQLGNIYLFMRNNENILIRKYYDDLESFDIEFKLKYVDNWLNKNKDNTIDMYLYNGISENCNKITSIIQDINNKIGEHKLKWFYNWRTLDLDNEICRLEKVCNILNERIKLINLA